MVMSSVAFAGSNIESFSRTNTLIHYERYGDSGIVEQVSEINGSIFYFVMKEGYVYSSQLTPCGIYHFAFSYIDSNVVASGTLLQQDVLLEAFDEIPYGIIDGDIVSRAASQFSIIWDNVDKFITDVTTFEIEYTETEKNSFTSNSLEAEGVSLAAMGNSNFPPYASLQALISNEFQLYSNRHVLTRTESRGGVVGTAVVTENHTVWSTPDRSWWIPVTTTIISIGVLIAAPATVVLNVISSAVIGVGVLEIWRGVTIGRSNLNQSFARQVRVNGGQIRYIAAYDIGWHVFSGDDGWDRNRSQAVFRNRHWDFNNASSLAITGLNNFFRSLGIW